MDSLNNVLSNDDRLYLYQTDWYVIRYMEAVAISNITGDPVPSSKLVPLDIANLREAARERLSQG